VCPTHSDSPGGNTTCACGAGSSGPDGGPCALCVPGKYKTAPGDVACSSCSAGWYSTAVGAASNKCKRCPPDSDAPAASGGPSDCTCRAETTGPAGGPCVVDVCPGWPVVVVDAAAAVLLAPPDESSDSYYAIESFLNHYVREKERRPSPACTDMYNAALAWMLLPLSGAASTLAVDTAALALGVLALGVAGSVA